eukprot:gene1638-2282_t
MWCEWLNDDKTAFAVKALWNSPTKIVICVRVRGTRDSHPWKQLVKKSEILCEAGIDNYIGTESLEGLFCFPSPKSALAFADRIAFTFGGEVGDRDSTGNCLKQIPVSIEFNCLQTNACVLHIPGCLRGILARRTSRTIHDDKQGVVSMYCVEEGIDTTSDTTGIELRFGHMNSEGYRVCALPYSMVGDSHLLACKMSTYNTVSRNTESVDLNDRAGRPIEDAILCNALLLYNKSQDVDFEQEMQVIASELKISRRRLFEALKELYDVAMYNQLEWMRIATSVYLLQNYRSPEYVVDLYNLFYVYISDETTDMLYESRMLMTSMERAMQLGGREIGEVVDQIFTPDVNGWQSNLIKRILSIKYTPKRKRED